MVRKRCKYSYMVVCVVLVITMLFCSACNRQYSPKTDKYFFDALERLNHVVFGAFSTVLVLWIHPLVTKLTDMLSPLARHIVSAVLFCGIVTDLVFTVKGMAGFREKIEEVSELVEQQKKALEEKIHDSETVTKLRSRRTEIKKKFTLQQRRLISAFPSLKFKKPQSNETLRSLRDVMKKIKEKKER